MKVASHDCILAPFQRNQIKATSTAPMSSIADHCAARLVIVPYSPFRARSLVCGWPTTAGPHAGPHKAGRHSPQPIERSHSQKFSAALASGVQVRPACVVNISIVPSGAILTPQTRSPPAMTARVARDTSVYRKAAAGLIDSSSCGLQTGGFGGS